MKKSINLGDSLLRGLYKTASDADKAILEEKYGKEFFVIPDIIDRTPTVEAALAIAGTSLEELKRLGDAKHEFACRVIETVIAVLNEGEKVNHANEKQTKYEPRFIHKPGLGLSYDFYDGWGTGTRCGPRLCYLKYNVMLHGIKILAKQYNDYLN